MATHAHNKGWAYRLGGAMGRAWRGYVRLEKKAARWLVAQGVPGLVASALPWLARLAVLGVLLYVAFWLALLLLFVVAVAWSAGHGEPVEEDEWPFISLDEPRKAHGYDPVPYNDFDHPDFPDEKDL
ncbi:DUF3742 family protein [Serratia ficaria]|uniref:DUF3742 family protein n=1 Tax=Serratia ficaria TaxID=61651 RepID=UPI002178CD70|nr:DUF3742 family protein [Serratia ficaria]CAI1202109.1 Uncharacterised protein [Serratia ficaria]CAI2527122.1 Uncharacterised protein [Serratia ficaria]CAI2536525.1 Uncharacterised protein [Serratia ficaria]CAI2785866.1 Uncharacterised protein [Serratia ficaria]